jgi:arginine transport system substrate-binding protein
MRPFFIRSFFAFVLGIFSFNALQASDFVVGTTSAYAPFVSLDGNQQYVGFDIDIAQEVSTKLNRTLVLKDLGSMPALFLALKQGKIDAIIWAISITKERQKQVTMIYYQGETVTSLPLLFWKTIPDDISCLEDLAGRPKAVLCVEAGSFQDSFLRKTEGLDLKHVDKVMDALLEIKYGKSLATMIDPSLMATVLKQFPEIKVLEVPLPPEEQSFGNGICMNKKNELLAQAVQRAVEELRKEGKIQELEQKWNLVGR